MYVVNRQMMKRIEQVTSEVYAIPDLLLMEQAASATRRIIEKEFSKQGIIVILVGAGNNGADSLSLARQLKMSGYFVKLALLTSPEKLSKAGQLHFKSTQALQIEMCQICHLAQLIDFIGRPMLVIDGLLGIGANRPLTGLYQQVVEWLNQQKLMVYALDIPTGIDADNGQVLGSAVRADKTISFGCPKFGNYLSKGREYNGQCVVADIGFPKKAIDQVVEQESQATAHLLMKETVENWWSVRPLDGHKGTFGTALIIAGNEAMGGAAILAGRAAYRSGVGLVHVATNGGNQTAIHSCFPEAIVHKFSEEIFNDLVTEGTVDRVTGILVGPGLGQSSSCHLALQSALDWQKPLVIDADGLNVLASNRELIRCLQAYSAPVILTPHIGEAARLLEWPIEKVANSQVVAAKLISQTYNCLTVLKSATTVVSLPNGKIYINIKGNEGMATAGAGDVLAGMTVGLLSAYPDKAEQVALTAVYYHSLAGQKVAERRGKMGMMASDLIEAIQLDEFY